MRRKEPFNTCPNIGLALMPTMGIYIRFQFNSLLFQFFVEDDEARADFTKFLWEIIWKGKVYFLPAALLQLSVLEWSAAFSLLIKFLRCLRKLGPFNEGGDREESCLARKDRTLDGKEKENRVCCIS